MEDIHIWHNVSLGCIDNKEAFGLLVWYLSQTSRSYNLRSGYRRVKLLPLKGFNVSDFCTLIA